MLPVLPAPADQLQRVQRAVGLAAVVVVLRSLQTTPITPMYSKREIDTGTFWSWLFCTQFIIRMRTVM